jgi:hypothetical protein
VVNRKQVHSQGQLPDVARTENKSTFVYGLLDSRHEQRCENGNNGNYHQEFDQSEARRVAVFLRGISSLEPTISFHREPFVPREREA